jgi:hypothetical protein
MLQLALRQQQLQAAQMQLKLQHQSQLVHRRQHQYQQQHQQPTTQLQPQCQLPSRSNTAAVSTISHISPFVSPTPSDTAGWTSPAEQRDGGVPGTRADGEQTNRSIPVADASSPSASLPDSETLANPEVPTSSPQTHVSCCNMLHSCVLAVLSSHLSYLFLKFCVSSVRNFPIYMTSCGRLMLLMLI